MEIQRAAHEQVASSSSGSPPAVNVLVCCTGSADGDCVVVGRGLSQTAIDVACNRSSADEYMVALSAIPNSTQNITIHRPTVSAVAIAILPDIDGVVLRGTIVGGKPSGNIKARMPCVPRPLNGYRVKTDEAVKPHSAGNNTHNTRIGFLNRNMVVRYRGDTISITADSTCRNQPRPRGVDNGLITRDSGGSRGGVVAIRPVRVPVSTENDLVAANNRLDGYGVAIIIDRTRAGADAARRGTVDIAGTVGTVAIDVTRRVVTVTLICADEGEKSNAEATRTRGQ